MSRNQEMVSRWMVAASCHMASADWEHKRPKGGDQQALQAWRVARADWHTSHADLRTAVSIAAGHPMEYIDRLGYSRPLPAKQLTLAVAL